MIFHVRVSLVNVVTFTFTIAGGEVNKRGREASPPQQPTRERERGAPQKAKLRASRPALFLPKHPPGARTGQEETPPRELPSQSRGIASQYGAACVSPFCIHCRAYE